MGPCGSWASDWPPAGELVWINPGERHTYWANEETAACMVFA